MRRVGDDVGFVLAAAQVGEVLAAQPVQLVLGKVGGEEDLGSHLEGAAPVLRQGLRGEQAVLPATVHGQAGADELEVVGDLLAGLARSALRQHVAYQSGNAG